MNSQLILDPQEDVLVVRFRNVNLASGPDMDAANKELLALGHQRNVVIDLTDQTTLGEDVVEVLGQMHFGIQGKVDVLVLCCVSPRVRHQLGAVRCAAGGDTSQPLSDFLTIVPTLEEAMEHCHAYA